MPNTPKQYTPDEVRRMPSKLLQCAAADSTAHYDRIALMRAAAMMEAMLEVVGTLREVHADLIDGAFPETVKKIRAALAPFTDCSTEEESHE